MPVSISKPLIFVVISVLVVALIYSSSSTFNAFAVPPHPNWGKAGSDCFQSSEDGSTTCCWTEDDLYEGGYIQWCQTCWQSEGEETCLPPERKSSSTGPIAPLQDGVLQQPPPPPGPGGPLGSLPEGGAVLPELQQTPPPQPGETAPTELAPQVDCNENPDDPLCETATIPEAVEQPEEQQSSSEDGEDSEDNTNDDDSSN